MRRCPNCKSPWVCWNWINNPPMWLHECHNCSNTFETEGHVDDGIPHDTLMKFGDHFVEPGRFEAELARDMAFMTKHFSESDELETLMENDNTDTPDDK